VQYTGIVRLDVILSNLKVTESGQGSRETGRIHKLKRTFKPKKQYWARKKRWVRKIMGESSGCGQYKVEVNSAQERPRLIEKSYEKEVATNVHLGSTEVTGCLDSLRRFPALGLPSKMMSSVPEGTSGVIGGISGGLGNSVEAMGLSEEEGCASYVKETKVCLSPGDGDGEDAMMAPERMKKVAGELVEGLSVLAESNTISTNGPSRKPKTPSSGPGHTGAVEAGPKPKPKMLHLMPKMKRVIRSGEGSSFTSPSDDHGSGQNREGNLPEIAQGLSEVPVPGQYSEGIPSTIAQTGMTVEIQPRHGGVGT
jgi:hypothetical protein